MASRDYNTSEARNVLGNKPHFQPFVRPSRSTSRTRSDQSDNTSIASTARYNIQPSNGVQISEKSTAAWAASWTPYTFKHPFLAVLSFVALSLCLVTFLLWWRSSTNYGLGPDDGSSALLFGWRYTPTLIAVIYVQMAAVLFGDIKRTEPYARLARSSGADASVSILEPPIAWWTALYDGFAKKKNGSRSWALICVSFLNIFGFLAISSLSSAYLYSNEVEVPKSTDFLQLVPTTDSPLPIDADRSTHFQTIANLLQNVSTSPWITDEYTILPVWPSNLQMAPINSLPSSSSQTWEAETMMFKTDFSCTSMTVDRETFLDVNYTKNGVMYGPTPSVSMIWSTPSGCKYGLSVDKTFFNMGGGSWSDASTFYYATSSLFYDAGSPLFTTNMTEECKGKEVLIVTDSWKKSGAGYSAQLCDTKYYMANVIASIGLTGDDPNISFNETEFEANKVSIPDTLVNTTEFRSLMLDSDWPTYMISILWSKTALLGGPSILLGALYDYNMTALIEDPNWVTSAAKSKQRYFGEVLQAALSNQGASRKAGLQGIVRDIENRVIVQAGVAIALGTLFALSFFLVLAVWWLSRLGRRPLNLKEDPASTLGVACLLTHNPRTQHSFQAFKQPSEKELHEKLDGVQFYTNSHGLSRINPDEALSSNSSQSENGTPKLLRLPALFGLVTALVAVVVGIAVLYHFAETSGLYQKAFVYEVNFSWLSNGISSVAPFSMIPTVIATGIGLWWSAIDDNFRRLQPFIAMSKSHPQFSRGASLSYQSSFWMWACMKAALNKHWLLALLTFGSSLSPIFTISMSALFDRGPGVVSQPITFERSIEIRDIPFVFPTEQSYYPSASNDYAAVILADLYKNLSTHWMYTATIQLALNGSQPAWSKDGWSFVPTQMTNLSTINLPNDLDASDQAVDGSQTNVSLATPAMRGRIECSEYPLDVFMNISNWLTIKDISNHTIWNTSTIPKDAKGAYVEGGYQLGAVAPWTGTPHPSMIYPVNTSDAALSGNGSCPGCTTVFVNPSQITCCENGSSSEWDPSVAVGYWSPNTNLESFSTRQWHRNFTAKWLYGNAVTGIKNNKNTLGGAYYDVDMLFPSIPSILLLDCKPIVESAEADIIVNPANGEIQSFNITSTPKELTEAFADNFLPHNQTHFSRETGQVTYNVTVSFGRLFMASMLTAADTLGIGGAAHTSGFLTEDLYDNTYNIRDEINGLNMDFMTYAMYCMVNKDPTALLNSTTYRTLAENTFTTFFQHYVSNDVSLETGGWGYQKINASLPSTLGPVIEIVNNYLPGTKAAAYQDVMHPISHTNRTAAAHVTQRVELLQMNAVAVWLSIGIMGWLIITTAVVAVLQKRYFGSLVRNVECLGDVLVLIAGSANLLQVVREIQAGRLRPDDYEHLRTRLGWFVDEDGGLRWGIEMEESFAEGPDVNWISEAQFSKEKGGTRTWTFHGDRNL
ncbi:uncharacterized protein N7443_010186 [Penicillium atrosanguineum]|uniref:uncharacterized protein n=1 Tax=Penicillium atrosanguineum TaxID=1132637 RepID=UPI00238C43E8|nr:uncharacterized protein N7443_010186 [Penicillium atrosanguineum]KAJ5289933.1 hypothetical protein N7443_010186 [Penicillium atrosanguineum]